MRCRRSRSRRSGRAAPGWMWPLVVMVVCLVAIGVGGFLYFTKLEMPARSSKHLRPATMPRRRLRHRASSVTGPGLGEAAPAVACTAADPVGREIRGRDRAVRRRSAPRILANEYVAGGDYKALALNVNGTIAFVTGQPNEEDAKNAALEQCQKRADATAPPRKCEIYAVGNTVVYPHGKPPVPPCRGSGTTRRPKAVRGKEFRWCATPEKARLENTSARPKNHVDRDRPGRAVLLLFRRARASRIGAPSSGNVRRRCRRRLHDRGRRRRLRGSGPDHHEGDRLLPCRPAIPRLRRTRATRWRANSRTRRPGGMRLRSAPWRPGLGLKAASEQNAINDALGDCVKRDSDCHVIAIGPFAVGPN